MIIDATNLIAGRLASFTAKKAILGETIDIVNCESAILTGNKGQIFARFKQKRDMGAPLMGPYFPKQADRILRRMIRGMLPYKQAKGVDAFKRIMCWKGVPEKFQSGKLESIDACNVSKIPNLKYITIGDVAKFLGGKLE
ncbi:50S ribosomal protein L13 [Candidatus Woesearchaeota archaeon]|jgi:large subunit ribosomal protein L13|nr:50S ribosomal protein L13 [Candidatus Woesearchaeota archaeon]MBT6519393.1 50S ribosomal protein L13 [Candidatus Woesearchaeota archaeon]MBT7366851.1 50S ribosomal protein L13 [Candidatus Woesearchaeota archaeon]